MLARRSVQPDHRSTASALPVIDCQRSCALAECERGCQAMVVGMGCAAPDACRLRALGVVEGTRVTVVDSRNGMLLSVRGSRLALGATIAAAIVVVPMDVAHGAAPDQASAPPAAVASHT